MPELDPYQPAPMNWCTACGVHSAHGTHCPVCLDNARRAADILAASRDRG